MLAFLNKAMFFEIVLLCSSLCLSHLSCSSKITPSVFLCDTRLITLLPSQIKGPCSNDGTRCLEPIIINSVFLSFRVNLFAISH